jgi:hypothetical protein
VSQTHLFCQSLLEALGFMLCLHTTCSHTAAITLQDLHLP